jgi:peptide/nickel transport system substrate-binding protein
MRSPLTALSLALPFMAAFPAAALEASIGLQTEASSLDPHFAIVGANQATSEHIFDRLIAVDDSGRVEPKLAVSWARVEDLTWEFKLRPGVRFHDGGAFTARDVAFSLERIPTIKNSPAPYLRVTGPVAEVTLPDDLTLRVRTRQPAPLLHQVFADLFVVSAAAAKGKEPSDFDAGRGTIGTGPYRFLERAAGERLVLGRNDSYWGPKPAIDKVTFRVLPNDTARVAALLAGDVDLIEAVPPADLENLSKNPRTSVASAISSRVIYLGLDQGRDVSPFVADKAGAPLAKNPLKDRRVRLAFSKAINRQAIVERLLSGSAKAAGQMVPEGLVGYTAELPPEAYDPDGAKRLLAEAGYPQGFRITLHSPSRRYVADEKVAQTVAQLLARIGIDCKVEVMPSNIFFTKAGALEFSFFLIGFGSGNNEATTALVSVLHTYDKERGLGANNRGRYSNPAFDKAIELAQATSDDAAREKLLQQAAIIGFRDVGIVPIHFQANLWAVRKGWTYEASKDEATLAMRLAPAKP